MVRPVLTPDGDVLAVQPRHTSRSSVISEATFPRRPDASTATDLSIKTHDLNPTAPPTLPYPSLAQGYPPRTSSLLANSNTPASSPTSKSGFFASLGRKASLSGKRDKSGMTSPTSPHPSSGHKVLTKHSSANPTPRPVNISSSPSVPGGPRAPPRRVLRSHTIMPTRSPFSPANSQSNELTRRPSLSNLSQESGKTIDARADPEFVRQVDRLVELLPHADRDVLAGYLRRAGQDMLAIGQYLEDEKSGALKT